MERDWIRIPVVICDTAKALSLQYTKRILPDFLIPYARMRLDRVMEAAQEREAGAGLEHCSRIMGCIDIWILLSGILSELRKRLQM